MKLGGVSLALLALAAALTAAAAGCQAEGESIGAGGAGGHAGAGAGGHGGHGGATSKVFAIYSVPASLDALAGETFFDQPWPNDLRLEKGSPRFLGYYNPLHLPILTAYIDTLEGLLDGFSPAGAGYLRFTGAIDTRTLPATPKAAMDPAAGVQLLDVDPSSPEHGKRKLVSVSFRADKGLYYLPDTLAFMPTPGFPLRPHTRYALVVTDAVHAEDGGPLRQSATVSMLVGATPADAATSAASAALASAVSEVEKAGVARAHVVHLAVFTTADPTKELIAVRDGVAKTSPPPTAEPTLWTVAGSNATYTEYQGQYGPSPNYQAGSLPFQSFGDGGGFQFVNGLPVVQSQQVLRFSLSVPAASACPMPPGGYPIVMYAHGTGGDWRSYVEDGTGPAMTSRCLAIMGVDQIFQGTRPGSMPGASEAQIGLEFYNFENPVAARTNGRQSAIDEVQRARLFTDSHMVVPASVSTTGADILFDAGKIMVFGHSQGGLNGPLFTAVDPSARGGVFSGSGAEITIALLDKTSPMPSVRDIVRALLGFNPSNQAELDIFHPTMSLLQSIIDVEDVLNYGLLQATEPRSGFAPKSVYVTEGINPDGTGDTYAPPPGIEAHALSIGLPLQLPYQHAIPQLAWGGPQPTSVPPAGLSGNLGDGAASGILAQWPVPAGDDGHFVVFDVPAAREQAAEFLQNLAASPHGLVPAPAIGPTDVDAGACTPFAETFTPACLGCLSANCCDDAVACFDVSDCFGYVSCQQNCPPAPTGSNGCLDACAQDFPMAQPTFGVMTACLQARCPGFCPY